MPARDDVKYEQRTVGVKVDLWDEGQGEDVAV